MKKLNKKGFTLVELLAVIVVLALLMVVATSSIGGALSNAKKNTLKTEAQKMMTAAYQDMKSSYMLSNNLNNISGTLENAAAGKIVKYVDGTNYTAYFQISAAGILTEYCVIDNKNGMSISHSSLNITVNNTDTATTPTISDSAVIKTSSLCSYNATSKKLTSLS